MSGANTISGSFPKVNVGFPGGGITAILFPINGNQGPRFTDKTNGLTASVPLVTSPTNTESWDITGFSVQIRLAASLSTVAAVPYWAKFGDIWAGILKDTSPGNPTPTLPIWPRAEFPSDLSTFSKIWEGDTDPITTVNANTNNPATYTLISAATQLPLPLRVNAGSQLSFAVVMTPSILDSRISIFFGDITYAVNYTSMSRGK